MNREHWDGSLFQIHQGDLFSLSRLNSCRPRHAPCLLVPSEGNNIHLVRLQDVRDLLILPIDDDELLLLFANAIEIATKLAHETLNDLRGDVFFLQDAILASLLERVDDKLGGVGLSEHTGCDLIASSLGHGRVRCAVGSEEELGITGGCCAQKGITIRGRLGNRLAEAERISSPGVDDDRQVMGRD